MDESQIGEILAYECYWEKALKAKTEWKKQRKVANKTFCIDLAEFFV